MLYVIEKTTQNLVFTAKDWGECYNILIEDEMSPTDYDVLTEEEYHNNTPIN